MRIFGTVTLRRSADHEALRYGAQPPARRGETDASEVINPSANHLHHSRGYVRMHLLQQEFPYAEPACSQPALRARDTSITVKALQPGPTGTGFFHRAGMDNTKVGSEGSKSENPPADATRLGIEALFDGEDHVYAASPKTRFEGALANLVSGLVKGAMHEKVARP